MEYSWFSCSVIVRFSTLYSCNSGILASVWSNVLMCDLRPWDGVNREPGMKLDEGKSSLTTMSPSSGSLRVNPLFGGSPPYRGGPRLPIKRKRSVPGLDVMIFSDLRRVTWHEASKIVQTQSRSCDTLRRDATKCKEWMSSILFFFSVPACSPGALAKVKLPRSRPTSSSGKKGKRAAWAKETETQPLGDKVQRLCRWTILPYIAIYCRLFLLLLAKCFLVPQRFVEYNEFEEEDSPEDRQQGPGQHPRKSNPAIVWMSYVFSVMTSSIIVSLKNVTYHCTNAQHFVKELVPAKCGIIRHTCRKKHLNLQNQTMTVLPIHLPLALPVPLGPSHIPLVMQRCSRNWYPQQRHPFLETPNTKSVPLLRQKLELGNMT